MRSLVIDSWQGSCDIVQAESSRSSSTESCASLQPCLSESYTSSNCPIGPVSTTTINFLGGALAAVQPVEGGHGGETHSTTPLPHSILTHAIPARPHSDRDSASAVQNSSTTDQFSTPYALSSPPMIPSNAGISRRSFQCWHTQRNRAVPGSLAAACTYTSHRSWLSARTR
jgi:hypothetical protein